MASKKNELNDFDFDDGLDMPDDGGSFDLDEPKDDRSPVTKVSSGFKAGVKDTVVSRDTVSKFMRKAMPREYGELADFANQTTGNVRDVYHKTAKELKPALNEIKRTTGRILPVAKGKIPGKLYEKLENFSKTDDRSNPTVDPKEAAINSAMADIFKVQQDQRKTDQENNETKEVLKENIEQSRHKDNINQFDAMRKSLSVLESYKTKIESGFQRKSLELQFRQYFVMNDLLESSKLHFEQNKEILENIRKNTGLPDFVKLKNTERLKEALRNKFIDGVSDRFIKSRREWNDKFFKGITSEVLNKIQNFKYALSAGVDAANAGADTLEMINQSGDMVDKHELAGNALGGYVGTWGTDKAIEKYGKKIGNKVLANKTARTFFNKTMNKFYSKNERINDIANGEGKFFGLEKVGILKELLQAGVRSAYAKDTSLHKDSLLTIDEPMQWSRRNANTLNTIIPGYLARIYREIQVFRTGDDKIGLTVYDHTKNTFTSEATANMNAFKHIFKKDDIEYSRKNVDEFMDDLDPDNKLSKKDKLAIGQAIAKRKGKRGIVDKDWLTEANNWTDQGLTRRQAQNASMHFQRYLKNDDDLGKMKNILKKYETLGTNVSGREAQIQLMVNLGYGPMLEKYGVISGDHTSIDTRRYLEIMQGGYYPDFSDAVGAMDEAVKANGGKLPPPAPNNSGVKAKKGKISSLIAGNNFLGSFLNRGITNNAPVPANTSTGSIRSQEITDAIYENSTKSEVGTIVDILEKLEKKFEEGINLNHLYLDAGVFGTSIGKAITGAGKGIFNAARWGKNKVFGGFNKALGGVKWAGSKAASVGKSILSWGKETGDVYIKGKLLPALEESKLKAGKYRDAATGKILEKFDDLKLAAGGVVDAETGEVILRPEDMKNAFVKSKVGTKLLSAYLGVKNFIGKTLTRGKGLVSGIWAHGFSIGKKLMNFGLDLAKEPYDVYVKGETNPRMTKSAFYGDNYFDQASYDAIHHPSEIKGPVINQQEQPVISDADLRIGLVDVNGVAVEFGKHHLLKRGAGKLKHRLGKFFGVFKGIKNKVKGMFSGAWDWLAGLFGDSGIFISTSGKKMADILEHIHDMLNERLPKSKKRVRGDVNGDGVREGSYADLMAKKKAKEEAEALARAKEKKDSGPGLMDKLKGLLGFFNKSKDEEEDGTGEDKKSLLDKLKDQLLGEEDIEGAEGDVGGKKRKGGKLDRFKRRMKARSRLRRMKLRGGKGGIGRKLMDRFGNRLGSSAEKGLFRRAAAGAAKLGGRAALGAGRLALGALGADSLLGWGLSTLGSWAVGGTMNLLGGIAGVVASPLFLGAATLAAVGTAAYFGYKWYKNKTMDQWMRLRYVQYGFADKEWDYLDKMKELEGIMEPLVITSAEGGKFDSDKIPWQKVTGIFDLDPNDEDMLENFKIWFGERFHQVFLTHVSALDKIKKGTKLDKIEDLTKAERLKLIDAVAMPSGPFSSSISPFKELQTLPSGYESVAAVVKEIKEAITAEKDTGKKPGIAGAAVAAGAAGAAGTLAVKAGDVKPSANTDKTKDSLNKAAGDFKKGQASSKPGELKREDPQETAKRRFSKLAGFLTSLTPAGLVLTTAKFMVSSTANTSGLSSRGLTLTPLDYVRMKSYGLKLMEGDKVSNVLALEQYIEPNVKFNSDKKATWAGDPNNVYEKMSTAFGVDKKDSSNANSWYAWFNKRFLPTYLNYRSALYAIASKDNVSLAVSALTPNQQLTIAQIVFGTEGIWDVGASPWYGYGINTDIKSVSPNIEALKNKSKDNILADNAAVTKKVSDAEKRKAELLTTTGSASGEGGAGSSTNSNQKSGGFWEDTKKAAGGMWDSFKTGVSNTMDNIQKWGEERSDAMKAGGGWRGGLAAGTKATKIGSGDVNVIMKQPAFHDLLAEMKAANVPKNMQIGMLGALAAESHFTPISENMRYSVDGMRATFSQAKKYSNEQLKALVGNPQAIANAMYVNQPGNAGPGSNDGWTYRGRGLIQLTGKANYAASSKAIFGDDRLVQNPDLANDPAIASKIAMHYYKQRIVPYVTRRLKSAPEALDLATAGQAVIQVVAGEGTNLNSGRLPEIVAKKRGYIKAINEKLGPNWEPGAGVAGAPAPTASGGSTPSAGTTPVAGGDSKKDVKIPIANQTPAPVNSASSSGAAPAASAPTKTTGNVVATTTATVAAASSPSTDKAAYIAEQQKASTNVQSAMSMNNAFNQSVGAMSTTLTQTLDVQKQQLAVLKSILSQMAPGRSVDPREGRSNSSIPTMPVSMKR